jgi:hypothetical protein
MDVETDSAARPTIEAFIAAPAWRRELYRRYEDYPPDAVLPPPSDRVVEQPTSVVVYFIQARDRTIKIGSGKDVRRRMHNLQVAHAYPLKLLAVASGGLSAEYRYHARFAAHRLHGEWFSPHPDILAEIERLTNGA